MYDRVTIHCLYSADSIWLSNRKKRAVTPPPAELRLQLDMSDFDWLPIQEQAEAEPKSNAADKKHTPDMEETTIKEAVAVAVPVPPPPPISRDATLVLCKLLLESQSDTMEILTA